MTNSENLNPGKLLTLSGAYWQTCTLHAAVKLDIFTATGDNPMGCAKLADKLHVQKRSLEMLLNALCAMELLDKKDGLYCNTAESDTFLSKNSKRYIGYIIMHHHHLVESWSKLDEAVKTGQPVRSSASHEDDEERRESFLMGMFNIAMGNAPRISEQIDLAGKKHLLDLGGGPGTYAIHFAKRNPALKASIFDLPTTRPFAEKTIKRFKLSDRVDFIDGNFLTDQIKGSYDVVWISHIFHAESPENSEKLMKKAVAALEPGGLIIIHDFILDNSKLRPLFPALFSLNMLIGTKAGQAYSEKEFFSILEKEGMQDIKRSSFKGTTESGIITGVKQKV